MQKKRIRAVRKEPSRLLSAQALVPADQIERDQLNDDDIYIFGFLTALITPNHKTLKKAISAGQPIYMIHTLPQKWAHPELWRSLGKLAVKSNMTSTIKLELGGQNKHHKFQSEHVILKPQNRVVVKQDFYAISYSAHRLLTH